MVRAENSSVHVCNSKKIKIREWVVIGEVEDQVGNWKKKKKKRKKNRMPASTAPARADANVVVGRDALERNDGGGLGPRGRRFEGWRPDPKKKLFFL
jgi:hypothetical protein